LLILLLFDLQGKGIVKTYWLLGREPTESPHARCPFGSILLEEISKVKSNEDVFSGKFKNVNEYEHSELRSLYSPVSFEDVKRTKSANNTPQSSPAKRSNLHCDYHHDINTEGQGQCTVNNNQDSYNNRQHDIDTLKEVLIKNKIQQDVNDTNKIHYRPSEYNHPSKSCQIL